jgi:phosphatidylinositol alpha-mannosyltransferase
MFLARHEKRKGLELLLRAFAETPDPAVLWIAGDGPETRRLKEMFPPSSRLHWLGVLSEMEVAQRLRGAHALCAPSLFGESFGLVLLEAMAARCRVVASDLDGYRMAAHGHAELFSKGNQDALTKALTSALNEADLDSSARSEALTKAAAYAQTLSFARLAERYSSIYASVCARQSRRTQSRIDNALSPGADPR